MSNPDTRTARNKLSIRQPNAMTNARYDYTKVEKNIIYQAIIALQDKMNDHAITADLFDQHLSLTIPYNRLKTWDIHNNLSRDLKAGVRSLRKKDYEIKTEDGWIDTGFITYAEYSEHKGLYLEISKALVPALVEIQKNFTAYNAVVALSLHSKYAQRFYEWCCRWRDTGWFEFTPDSLNEVLKTKMTTGSLKERVIIPAETELKNLFIISQCDVCFSVEEERGGKGRGGGVKKWKFIVKTVQKEEKARELATSDYLYVMDFLKKAWGNKPDLINKASEQIVTSKCVIMVADRFAKIKPREVENLGGYVRTVLTQEFNIKI